MKGDELFSIAEGIKKEMVKKRVKSKVFLNTIISLIEQSDYGKKDSSATLVTVLPPRPKEEFAFDRVARSQKIANNINVSKDAIKGIFKGFGVVLFSSRILSSNKLELSINFRANKEPKLLTLREGNYNE